MLIAQDPTASPAAPQPPPPPLPLASTDGLPAVIQSAPGERGESEGERNEGRCRDLGGREAVGDGGRNEGRCWGEEGSSRVDVGWWRGRQNILRWEG